MNRPTVHIKSPVSLGEIELTEAEKKVLTPEFVQEATDTVLAHLQKKIDFQGPSDLPPAA